MWENLDYLFVINCINEKTLIKEEQNRLIEEKINNKSKEDSEEKIIVDEEMERKFANLNKNRTNHSKQSIPEWAKKARNIK